MTLVSNCLAIFNLGTCAVYPHHWQVHILTLIDLHMHHCVSWSFLPPQENVFYPRAVYNLCACERSSINLTSGRCSHGSGTHSLTLPSPALVDSIPSPPPPLALPRLLAGSCVTKTQTQTQTTMTSSPLPAVPTIPIPAVELSASSALNRSK